VEALELPFRAGSFDCIVLADVLEHLRDPWSLLTRLQPYLADDGTVVASIPNVGHYPIILGLVRHRWRYTPEGVLDRTHLRFFTLETIRDMFTRSGFHIVHVGGTVIANAWISGANRRSRGLLGRILREYLYEQYLITAIKVR